ncbi:hypothetical protein T265_01237, partial [Opisthorchis viverrini]
VSAHTHGQNDSYLRFRLHTREFAHKYLPLHL